MKYLLIILSIGFAVDGYSIGDYKIDDKLYVWAQSGLNLRADPYASDVVVQKIEFGGEVIVKKGKPAHYYAITWTPIKDNVACANGKSSTIVLRGHWVKVIYKEQVGYIFDAYLMRQSPQAVEHGFPPLFNYLMANYNPVTYIERRGLVNDNKLGTDKIVFSNGMYLLHHAGEKSTELEIIIPNFTLEEALLLIQHVDKDLIDVKQKEETKLLIRQSLGNYRVMVTENVVIIKGQWSC